jgi:hypothetical protein
MSLALAQVDCAAEGTLSVLVYCSSWFFSFRFPLVYFSVDPFVRLLAEMDVNLFFFKIRIALYSVPLQLTI